MIASYKRPPEAFRSANLFELGLGYVMVSRFKSDGRVEAGVFLLDVYCLGVKNAFFTMLHQSEYDDTFLDRIFTNGGREPMEPSCARRLVEDAAAYAQNLGFAPHADYKKGCRVFGGISASECELKFSFGKDGKPYYIQGPNDSPEKCGRIISMLEARCGEGNFHYVAVSPGFGNQFED